MYIYPRYNQLVPGIIMAGAFLQAKILATPLLLKLGDGYDLSSPCNPLPLAAYSATYAERSYSDTHTMVEHVVFIKTLSAPLQWTDDLRRIVGEPAPVLKQPDMFYVGVPAFLPFTQALLAMSELPIEIIDISGHEALQVKVSCPASTGKVFENDLSALCIPGSRIMFRFQYPQGAFDERWHYAVALPIHHPLPHCSVNFWRAAPRDMRFI